MHRFSALVHRCKKQVHLHFSKSTSGGIPALSLLPLMRKFILHKFSKQNTHKCRYCVRHIHNIYCKLSLELEFALQQTFVVILLFIMSVISESASHSTLVSTVSNWNIQSDGLDIRTADTLIPKERLSDETIHLLREARSKLTEDSAPAQPKGKKRKKFDIDEASTSAASDRNSYPVESKPIYLRLKNNQRKKISLASTINRMHSELLKSVYPTCVQFKFNINSTRSKPVRKIWDQAIKECKEKRPKHYSMTCSPNMGH